MKIAQGHKDVTGHIEVEYGHRRSHSLAAMPCWLILGEREGGSEGGRERGIREGGR